jgi:hypothetical protein
MEGKDFHAPPEALGLVGGVVVAALLLRLAPDLQTVFFLVPGHTTTRPWQVITAGYFEDSFLNLLLGSAALLACGVLLRPTWGGRELLRFVVLTNGVQGCLTWAGMILMYILFREEHFLFSRLGGLTGVMGGLAVALKQHVHVDAAFALPVVMGGNGPAAGQLAVHAMRHAPTLVLVWSAVLLLGTHSGPPDELLFAWNGILAAWVYLRYYQPRAAGMAGDPSNEFAFASLFPPPLEPPLRAVGEASFVLVSMCGCFPPQGWAALAAGAPQQPVLPPPSLPDLLRQPSMPAPASVTTSDPEVAERRRERARALIEARLAQKSGTPSTAAEAQSLLGTPSTPIVEGGVTIRVGTPWTPMSTPGATESRVDTPRIRM